MNTTNFSNTRAAAIELLNSVCSDASQAAPDQIFQIEQLLREFASNGFHLSALSDVEYIDDFVCDVEISVTARSDGAHKFGRGFSDKPSYVATINADEDDEAASRAEMLIESLVGLIGEIYEYRAAFIAKRSGYTLSPSL